ncbi:MAG: hypothetical protein Q7S34_01770 [bacterium]|nr:hypothetical protein [bacterium]
MKKNNTYPPIVAKIIEQVGDFVRVSMDGSTSIAGVAHYRAEASRFASLLSTLSAEDIPENLHAKFLKTVVWWHENRVNFNIPGVIIEDVTYDLGGVASYRFLKKASIGKETIKKNLPEEDRKILESGKLPVYC